MRIEQISIKTLLISILLILAVIASLLSFAAGVYSRKSALTAQAKSLSRIIKVATDESIQQLQNESGNFGSKFEGRGYLRDAISELKKTGRSEQLASQLNEPFLKGFSGARVIDLVKLRVYDLDLNLLSESRDGAINFPPRLPNSLYAHALNRKGTDRLKSIDGLWISPNGPLYSLLIPIGGLRLSGYLEIVTNPIFNLEKVANLTKMPLKIYGSDGEQIYQSPQNPASPKGTQLPVEYLLKTTNGDLAYRLVGLENVEQLNKEMQSTQTTITLSFLILTFSTLVLALWAFTRFLFRPINQIMNDINQYSVDGSLAASPDQGNTKEFQALSNAFSQMAHKIQENISELERLSSLDGLTGVANRRTLDIALNNEWQRAQRENAEISILMIDIDLFKLYNDHYGHQAGDNCLRLIAAKIAQVATRPGDLVARYGGEEFSVLLPGTSSKGASSVATHILDAITSLNITHEKSTVSNIVTLSIGISTLSPNDKLKSRDLVGYADIALYQAKKAGRNQFRISSPIIPAQELSAV